MNVVHLYTKECCPIGMLALSAVLVGDSSMSVRSGVLALAPCMRQCSPEAAGELDVTP